MHLAGRDYCCGKLGRVKATPLTQVPGRISKEDLRGLSVDFIVALFVSSHETTCMLGKAHECLS